MSDYSSSSPYKTTPYAQDGSLGYFSIRPVPAQDDDIVYTIEAQYENRPDLLAHDIYGTSKLWWVFTQRNMDTIEDPVNDFKAGTQIYLPKSSNIKRVLGI